MKGKKGARVAIGKKRADGQKCSHVSLLGRARGPFKQQNKRLQRLDKQPLCCRVGCNMKMETVVWRGDSKKPREDIKTKKSISQN